MAESRVIDFIEDMARTTTTRPWQTGSNALTHGLRDSPVIIRHDSVLPWSCLAIWCNKTCRRGLFSFQQNYFTVSYHLRAFYHYNRKQRYRNEATWSKPQAVFEIYPIIIRQNSDKLNSAIRGQNVGKLFQHYCKAWEMHSRQTEL